MRTRRIIARTGQILAASAVVALVLSGGIAPAQALSSTTRCGFATMISLRGTNETAGTGSANAGRTYASGGAGATLNNLVGYAKSDPLLPVYQEAILYPAVALEWTSPLSSNYITSVQM